MTEPRRGEQDPIREALRRLPRVTASTGFNRRLLDRTGTRPPQRAPAWLRLAAAAAVLTAVVGGLLFTQQRNQRIEFQRQRAALLQRHEELRLELAEIRKRAVRPSRLYLGSASDVDLVLDLEPWMQPQPSTLPAAYNPSRP